MPGNVISDLTRLQLAPLAKLKVGVEHRAACKIHFLCSVIPAMAGIPLLFQWISWTPAFAGVTSSVRLARIDRPVLL